MRYAKKTQQLQVVKVWRNWSCCQDFKSERSKQRILMHSLDVICMDLDRLLDFMLAEGSDNKTGFKWKSGKEKCTQGIWIWSKPWVTSRAYQDTRLKCVSMFPGVYNGARNRTHFV
eukprot:377517-Amphidinium_carterae.1